MNTIKIIQLTPEEIQSIISETIKSLLEEYFKNSLSKDPNELLTRKETAELLKINLATLWSWSKTGKLSSVGIGNRVYYKRCDIEKALIRIN